MTAIAHRPIVQPRVAAPSPVRRTLTPATQTAPVARISDGFQPVHPRRRVLIVLPETGFDPTEVSVPWKLLQRAGHEVVFATASGRNTPTADPLPLRGPFLLKSINATAEVKDFYKEMSWQKAFRNPLRFDEIDPSKFDGVLIPGGEGPGMLEFLGNETLQQKVAGFFAADKQVAALCHGVLVAARSKDPSTGKSVLAHRHTATLPGFMEKLGSVGFALSGRPRIYDFWAEDEVKAALDNPAEQYERGPLSLRRGSIDDDRGGFVVRDGNYVSARWPGDAYAFGKAFVEQLERNPSTVLVAKAG